MVVELNNIFNVDDINGIINGFTVDYEIGTNTNHEGDEYYNQYKKQLITLDDHIKETIYDSVYNITGTKDFKISYTRVNLVEENTNQNDPFHTDNGFNLIVTHYPNDDYDGGEFEWIEDGKPKRIKPKKGSTLIMLNNPPHRVLNVTKGKRFSIVTFCVMNIKKNLI